LFSGAEDFFFAAVAFSIATANAKKGGLDISEEKGPRSILPNFLRQANGVLQHFRHLISPTKCQR
jgi:hypothetical protein